LCLDGTRCCNAQEPPLPSFPYRFNRSTQHREPGSSTDLGPEAPATPVEGANQRKPRKIAPHGDNTIAVWNTLDDGGLGHVSLIAQGNLRSPLVVPQNVAPGYAGPSRSP
jgi:hypothetical protein